MAFQTYTSGIDHIQFRNDTKVEDTWDNMTGPAVKGTYTHVGDTITVLFEEVPHSSYVEMRFRQLDDCSIANFYVREKNGTVDEDVSDVYRRTEPRCPHL